MPVDDDLLYHGSAFSYLSSLYLFSFLSFHTLNNAIYRQDFTATLQGKMLIFGIQIHNGMLYCGI